MNKIIILTLAQTLALFTLLISPSITFANNCADKVWIDEQWYDAGETVEFDGDIYVAVYDNPGYNPIISPWFWDWKSTAGSCNYNRTSDNTTNGCFDNEWIDGQWYNAGETVELDGNVYIAVFGNPGYNPTISTWFWDWYSTSDSSCNIETPTITRNPTTTTQAPSSPIQTPATTQTSTSDCGTEWNTANLTYFSSYPDPNESQCRTVDECPWMGQFQGLSGVKSESWVKQNNIIAVHSRDFEWLNGKTLKLRQGTKEINATVYDACSDLDCDGCCSANLGKENFLIDIEKNTMERFGSYYGTVEWQICE